MNGKTGSGLVLFVQGRLSWRLFAGQQVLGLISHQANAGRGTKRWNQADLPLLSSNRLPWNPNTVGRSEFTFSVMPFQLFCRKDEFFIRGRVFGVIGIVVGMNDELAIYGNRLVFRIIKIEPTTEPLGRCLALCV